jgi:hypothetical protein
MSCVRANWFAINASRRGEPLPFPPAPRVGRPVNRSVYNRCAAPISVGLEMTNCRAARQDRATQLQQMSETWLREHRGLVGSWISTQGDCVARLTMASESLDRQPDLEDFDRVEVEFGIQAALDSSGLSKAVLLAGKQQITNWFARISAMR